MKSEIGRALSRYLSSGDPALLRGVLAEKVQFRSPYAAEPAQGREVCAHILETAREVFEDFRYGREVASGKDVVLGFSARMGGAALTGVQFLRLDRKGLIEDFELFLSPVDGMQALGAEIGRRLQSA